jgi:hypothetical protein
MASFVVQEDVERAAAKRTSLRRGATRRARPRSSRPRWPPSAQKRCFGLPRKQRREATGGAGEVRKADAVRLSVTSENQLDRPKHRALRRSLLPNALGQARRDQGVLVNSDLFDAGGYLPGGWGGFDVPPGLRPSLHGFLGKACGSQQDRYELGSFVGHFGNVNDAGGSATGA